MPGAPGAAPGPGGFALGRPLALIIFLFFYFLPKTPVSSAAGPGRGVHDKDKAVSGLSATGGGQGLREEAAGQSPGGACDLGPSPPRAPSATTAPSLPPSTRCGQSPPGLDPLGPCPDPSVGANVKLLPLPSPLLSFAHEAPGGRQQRLPPASQPLCLSLSWPLLPSCPRASRGCPGPPGPVVSPGAAVG